jgi:hypothetical protein
MKYSSFKMVLKLVILLFAIASIFVVTAQSINHDDATENAQKYSHPNLGTDDFFIKHKVRKWCCNIFFRLCCPPKL